MACEYSGQEGHLRHLELQNTSTDYWFTILVPIYSNKVAGGATLIGAN